MWGNVRIPSQGRYPNKSLCTRVAEESPVEGVQDACQKMTRRRAWERSIQGGIIASSSLSPFFFMGFLDSRTSQKETPLFLYLRSPGFLPSPMIKARTRRHFALPFRVVRR